MRFDSVRAHPFGPFEDETLELAPRMTVIYGPNEAGKSSWHAALYVGLCGMRRGRGAARLDREFQDRHRPWDGEGGDWMVSATVALADGRRVELRQDLTNKTNCSATDADLAGRDYANEILHEGSPDGSRFLGLSRSTFRGAACVEQADVLGVLEDSEALQEDLQRAAATAGAHATAARALDLLREYLRERVGGQRATKKPMPLAIARKDAAQAALDGARHLYAEYGKCQARLESLARDVKSREQRVDALRVVIAEQAAADAERRVERAAGLQSRFPDGFPRPTLEDEHLISQVADALAGWRARPDAIPPTGKTVAELEQEAANVTDSLAAATRESEESAPTRRATPLLALGLVGAVGGVALLLSDLQLPGIAALVVGAGLLVWWGLSRRRTAPPRPDPAVVEALISERLEVVEARIEQRREADRRQEAVLEQHARAEAALGEAVAAAGLTAVGPEAQVEALVKWQRSRQQRLGDQVRLGMQWDELQQILGGRTVSELRALAARLRVDAEARAATVEATLMAEIRREAPAADQLERFEQDARDAHAARDQLRGELAQREADLPSVVDAEEELAAAERELAHLQRLDATLDTTIRFLQRAEERVHRDIAPILKKTVLEELRRVTGGRYDDCKVDPESLEVDVRSGAGPWRAASYLSRGTAEQVYLLLRLALARHLTLPEETCPMILDDVVAACDVARKAAVLATLHSMSQDAQVILFTHEDDVLAWAEQHLAGPADRVVVLPPPVPPRSQAGG